MTLTPPSRSQPLVTKGLRPTSRTAEFMERLADAVNGEIEVNVQPVIAPTVSTVTGQVSTSAAESLTFTYNPDGTVNNINGQTTDIDFTYSGGLVETIDDQSTIKTFAYNGSNQLISITVT